MGVDEPRSALSSMTSGDIMPRTRLSGGEKSALPESAVVKKPYDLTGIADGLNRLASTVVSNMAKQKKERDDLQRNVDYTKLTTQNTMDGIQSYDLYKQTFTGDPDTFTEGYLKTYDQYNQTQLSSIADPKLRASYEQFTIENRAKLQLKGLQDQQALYIKNYSDNFKATLQAQDDLIRINPTTSTLEQAARNIDTIYAPAKARLDAYGHGDTAQSEIDTAKTQLAKSMVLRQAAVDPDQAVKTLHDPDVNQYIEPDDQLTLEGKIATIKNQRNAPLTQQAELASRSYVDALAIGKDGSELRSQILQLASMGEGIVSPQVLQKMAVAERMAPQFSLLRDNIATMSDAEFDRALASLNPVNGGGPADVSLEDQLAFYNEAATALKSQREVVQANPISATIAVTGAKDPETAATQYAAARLRAGANIKDINVMDQVEAQRWMAQINNTMTSGSVDQAVQLFNDLRSQYAADPQHLNRMVAPGTDLMDLVLNQLSKNSAGNNPLTKKMIAVYHLLPKDQDIDSHNSLLLKAAMMTPEQRRSLIQSSGDPTLIDKNSLDPLAAHLQQSSKVWRTFFSPSSFRTGEDDQLRATQRQLLLDTVLLNMSTGGYKATGGVFGIGQTSASDNAADAIIKQYLPYAALTVQGNPVTVGAGNTWQSPELFGQKFTLARKDWRMNIKSSDVLIPKHLEGTITPDLLTQYTSHNLLNKDWVFNNVRLPGINDVGGGPASTVWKKSPEFTSKVDGIATRVQADPNDLMAVMSIESGLRANARNSKSSATGLIQWMKYPGGLSRDQFASMNELDQLSHVEQWFSRFRGKLNSPGKVYLAVAAPGVLSNLPAGAGPDTVVYQAGSKEAKANPLWQDKSGNVTLGKLDALVRGRKQQVGVKAGPTSYMTLKPGQQQILDSTWNLINQNLSLRNNENMTGVRVFSSANNHEVPIMGRDGRPIEFSFDEIQRFRPVIGGR